MRLFGALTVVVAALASGALADSYEYSEDGSVIPITYLSKRNPGAKPSPMAGGGYWPLVQSMEGDHVYSIERSRVQRWHYPKKERFNGLTYWTIEIEYGEPVNTKYTYKRPQLLRTAKAYVRNGVVQFWKYSDVDGYVR